MANGLRMAQVQAIHVLRARGWSFGRIGRELGIHRDTVRRHVQMAESSAADPSVASDVQNRPNPPTGSNDSNSTQCDLEIRPNLPAGSEPASTAEPHREAIVQGLEHGLSCQRIWQDLKTEHGFAGSYDSVKRLARRLESGTPLPFRCMECAPGEEAQIDFGTGAPVITSDGKRRRTHVFRMVLSHSRNRPIEDWGKLIGDVPSASAILDRFLHHAEVLTLTGKSYRLKGRAGKDQIQPEEKT